MDQAIASWKGFVAARQGFSRLKMLLVLYPDRDARFALPPPSKTLVVEGLTVAAPATSNRGHGRHRSVHLFFSKGEMKNEVELEFQLPSSTIALLDRYLRDTLTGDAASNVLEGRRGADA